ncbi:hypothetical protein B0H17DRAFT_1191458 [Mycena rosella]|uniref:Uncharacterized protein n=1 Tax=Mycena rosella TaxID=1033263 RepID=A0AAD7H0A9_MYCRO|nr:hypothetical protein B0H17DRAFT_1191458 [Mycena rosella]
MAGRHGSKTKRGSMTRSYTGQLRPMAQSEPPEGPAQHEQIAAQNPTGPTPLLDSPLDDDLRPAVKDWQANTIFGPLGLSASAGLDNMRNNLSDDEQLPSCFNGSPSRLPFTPQTLPSKAARAKSAQIQALNARVMPAMPLASAAPTPKRCALLAFASLPHRTPPRRNRLPNALKNSQSDPLPPFRSNKRTPPQKQLGLALQIPPGPRGAYLFQPAPSSPTSPLATTTLTSHHSP